MSIGRTTTSIGDLIRYTVGVEYVPPGGAIRSLDPADPALQRLLADITRSRHTGFFLFHITCDRCHTEFKEIQSEGYGTDHGRARFTNLMINHRRGCPLLPIVEVSVNAPQAPQRQEPDE